VGEYLLAGLIDLQNEMGGRVSGARGRGLMIAFDLPGPGMRKRVVAAALEEGLLLLPCGPRSIRFRPPLNLSRAEADAGLERLRGALKCL
jgi:L-lysine 6-transaminase